MSDEHAEPSSEDRALLLLSESMAELRRRLASEPIDGAEIASAFQPGEFGLGPWPTVRAGGRTFSAIPFAAPRSEAGAAIRIAPLREDPLPQAGRRPWRAEVSFASSSEEAAALLLERIRLSSTRPSLPFRPLGLAVHPRGDGTGSDDAWVFESRIDGIRLRWTQERGDVDSARAEFGGARLRLVPRRTSWTILPEGASLSLLLPSSFDPEGDGGLREEGFFSAAAMSGRKNPSAPGGPSERPENPGSPPDGNFPRAILSAPVLDWPGTTMEGRMEILSRAPPPPPVPPAPEESPKSKEDPFDEDDDHLFSLFESMEDPPEATGWSRRRLADGREPFAFLPNVAELFAAFLQALRGEEVPGPFDARAAVSFEGLWASDPGKSTLLAEILSADATPTSFPADATPASTSAASGSLAPAFPERRLLFEALGLEGDAAGTSFHGRLAGGSVEVRIDPRAQGISCALGKGARPDLCAAVSCVGDIPLWAARATWLSSVGGVGLEAVPLGACGLDLPERPFVRWLSDPDRAASVSWTGPSRGESPQERLVLRIGGRTCVLVRSFGSGRDGPTEPIWRVLVDAEDRERRFDDHNPAGEPFGPFRPSEIPDFLDSLAGLPPARVPLGCFLVPGPFSPPPVDLVVSLRRAAPAAPFLCLPSPSRSEVDAVVGGLAVGIGGFDASLDLYSVEIEGTPVFTAARHSGDGFFKIRPDARVQGRSPDAAAVVRAWLAAFDAQLRKVPLPAAHAFEEGARPPSFGRPSADPAPLIERLSAVVSFHGALEFGAFAQAAAASLEEGGQASVPPVPPWPKADREAALEALGFRPSAPPGTWSMAAPGVEFRIHGGADRQRLSASARAGGIGVWEEVFSVARLASWMEAAAFRVLGQSSSDGRRFPPLPAADGGRFDAVFSEAGTVKRQEGHCDGNGGPISTLLVEGPVRSAGVAIDWSAFGLDGGGRASDSGFFEAFAASQWGEGSGQSQNTGTRRGLGLKQALAAAAEISAAPLPARILSSSPWTPPRRFPRASSKDAPAVRRRGRLSRGQDAPWGARSVRVRTFHGSLLLAVPHWTKDQFSFSLRPEQPRAWIVGRSGRRVELREPGGGGFLSGGSFSSSQEISAPSDGSRRVLSSSQDRRTMSFSLELGQPIETLASILGALEEAKSGLQGKERAADAVWFWERLFGSGGGG